jgi:hypothetical protein
MRVASVVLSARPLVSSSIRMNSIDILERKFMVVGSQVQQPRLMEISTLDSQ